MPEIEAEEINKVSNVPRFSIVKFIRFGVNTAEFVIKVLPETSEEDAFFNLNSQPTNNPNSKGKFRPTIAISAHL